MIKNINMKFFVSSTKLIRMLIYLLAFSITFYNIGFSVGGIMINIPTISILILDIILILRGKFNRSDLIYISLFISWSLIGVIYRYPFWTYFPSLVFSLCLILPLSANWNNVRIDKSRILDYMILGAIFSMILIPFELYFRYEHLFGLVGNELWFSIDNASFCYYRPSALMLEPSHYVFVLTFIYILVDIFKERNIYCKYFLLYKYCYFFTLILSISLSGMVLFFIYIILKLLFRLSGHILYRKIIVIRKRQLVNFIMVLILIFILNAITNNFIGRITSKVAERVLVTKDVVLKQKAEGSSGLRSSFIWVSKIYVNGSPITSLLMGEGFSNYRYWLKNHTKQIGYDSGEAYNLYLILLLSVGIIGLIIFMMMVLVLSHVCLNSFSEMLFIFIFILSFFTHGYLMMYWVWFPLLFFRILKSNNV